jgi:catechol-2,3-dioxygenase
MNILEIQLLSPDLFQTKKFYHEVLGLAVLFTDDSSISFSAGLSKLIFKRSNSNNPFYHFAFTIPSNKFEEAQAWASRRVQLLPVTAGGTIADFKNWNAKAFYFYDNNQNIVEFIARFDLANDSQNPFDGASVFSISEIGIVTGNAKTYAGKMISEYGLNFFSKQPPQDDFVAIGDDHGLFIVVNDKRNWYPTNKASGKYWTAIKFERSGKISNLEIPGE